MWKPLWDQLKAIVQHGADASKNLTNDAQKKQAIQDSVEAFVNQPTPTSMEEMVQRQTQAVSLQGRWNAILSAGGQSDVTYSDPFAGGGWSDQGQSDVTYSDP